MSKQKSVSAFENMFTTQQAFRRNKHYYDAIRLNHIQHHTEQERRKPVLGKHSPLGNKIESVFQSAKIQREGRVDEDINRFKFRMSFYNKEENNPQNNEQRYGEISKQWSPPKNSTMPSSIKGVPLQKLQSRQSLNNLKTKQCMDQRQFNNFYMTKNDLSRTPRIENYSPRNVNIALEHMNDLYYDSKEAYENSYFDRGTNSCMFNLKKQNDRKGRYFFIPQREQNVAATEMKPQNVAKSFSVATSFKNNKILHFYKTNGRELPSNFDQRYASPNKNFYKDSSGRMVKKDMSFTAKRYKDQLLARDLDQIKKSKRPYFNRDQICDEQYFKQEKRYR